MTEASRTQNKDNLFSSKQQKVYENNEIKRLKRVKPNSMNETLLNRIMKDSVHNRHEVKPSSGNKVSNSHHSIAIAESSTAQTILDSSSDIVNTNSAVNNTQRAPLKTSLGVESSRSSLSKKTQSTARIQKEIPIPWKRTLSKAPSNGISQVVNSKRTTNINSTNQSTLKAEISLASINSNSGDEIQISSRPVNTVGTHHKFDSFKLTEELMDCKLANSKLRNEISIMTEKMKTLKQIIAMKKSENELIKTRYAEIVDDYKREIERLIKMNIEYEKSKELIEMHRSYIKSTIAVLVEMIEIFVFNKHHTRNSFSENTNNNNLSVSIDVYDSYCGDEDRRVILLDHIQGVLFSKLNMIRRIMNVNLEKELERIKGWGALIKNNLEQPLNLSSMKMNKVTEELESFRKLSSNSIVNNSNDLFDLSISNQFFIQSPKFNSPDQTIPLQSENKKDKKEDEMPNFNLNDSIFNELKKSMNISHITHLDDSFGEIRISPTNGQEKKSLNMLDCSIIDIMTESKLIPGDPQLSGSPSTDLKGNPGPLILSPIISKI